MTITVLMTVYNGEKFLHQSVSAVLAQTYADFEFLIVDDASTDNSLKILRSLDDPRVRIISNPVNLGQTRSLNVGLSKAKGAYIARMDADDLAYPHWLEVQVALMEKNPHCAVLSPSAAQIDMQDKVIKVLNTPKTYQDIIFKSLYASPINHVGSLLRKDIITQAGGYPEKYKIVADYALWSQLLKGKAQIINHDKVLVAVRTHPQSISAMEANQRVLKEMVEVMQDNMSFWSKYPVNSAGVKEIWGLVYAPTKLRVKEFNKALVLLKDVYKGISKEAQWFFIKLKAIIYLKRFLNLKFIPAIDTIGLMGIAAYSVCSAVFYSDFAELHIQLPWLNFPIFIGEILLFFLVLLFGIKLFLLKRVQRFHWMWAAYFAMVIAYTLFGYIQWGPLALRNAALFYYAIIALSAYSFYHPRYFMSKPLGISLLFLLIGLLVFKLGSSYFWFSTLTLAVFLLIQFFPKQLWLLIPVVIFSHVEVMFVPIRAHMVGVFSALVFLLIIGVGAFIRWPMWMRGIFLLVLSLGVIAVHSFFGDHNAIKSMFNFKSLSQSFHKYDRYVQTHPDTYSQGVVPYKLFHQNEKPTPGVQKPASSIAKSLINKFETLPSTPMPASKISSFIAKPAIEEKALVAKVHARLPIAFTVKKEVKVPVENIEVEPLEKCRNLDVATNNILFRIFIWRDMWRELANRVAIFGVGFGEPQRSRSLEILGWGDIEWARDGWVAPHNSFFHMVYRAGIFGLVFAGGFFYILVQLTRLFISLEDFGGILLLSILIYWAMVSMFSVTLELPYNAIFIWGLLGCIYGYAKFKKKARGSRITRS